VYDYSLHRQIKKITDRNKLQSGTQDDAFYTRFIANASSVRDLYSEIYGRQPDATVCFELLFQTILNGYMNRPETFRKSDDEKEKQDSWFLSNKITGMSLYVDRFAGNLVGLANKLPYFHELGVNLLHLMPVFESPANASDGGYAVSDFRKVDNRFGNIGELRSLRTKMEEGGMHLMLDIVLNHTSDQHEWAKKAKLGETGYQDYYYMFDSRTVPDQFEQTMPEIFPEGAPGSFTYIEECKKWVMTVFHQYQWDLNYRNPRVFIEMLDTIFFYANLGVDILRIDAPAFIWKEIGTTCQNLPKAHVLLRLIKLCVQIAAPGMALLGEAIVAPADIMKYFGTGDYTAHECDFAYNATQMALQWDALATGDTSVMLAAQDEILQKPFGCSWIDYTRCHDDIGLGYGDDAIRQAGFNPFEHRKFIKEYYSGHYPGSEATGALFSVNPKTQDARISGSLASLCGLEKAISENDQNKIVLSIRKILMMQAQSFFIGGLPMLFYGDEAGYTNDYSYLDDPAKSYDNRWMHRPVIHWEKNKKRKEEGTPEQIIFSGTARLNDIRKKLSLFSDHKNLVWLTPHNIHVAGWMRSDATHRVYCLFNYTGGNAFVTWYIFKEHGRMPTRLFDYWDEKEYEVGPDHEYLVLKPYSFMILESSV
jgi:amylosucrase